jgi:hypothetical protein
MYMQPVGLQRKVMRETQYMASFAKNIMPNATWKSYGSSTFGEQYHLLAKGTYLEKMRWNSSAVSQASTEHEAPDGEAEGMKPSHTPAV